MFSDTGCQLPYIVADGTVDLESSRSIVEIPKKGPPTDTFVKRAFKAIGGKFRTPSNIYKYTSAKDAQYWQDRINLGDAGEDSWKTQAGCTRVSSTEYASHASGVPEFVYKTTPAKMPTYTPPLRIEEK